MKRQKPSTMFAALLAASVFLLGYTANAFANYSSGKLSMHNMPVADASPGLLTLADWSRGAQFFDGLGDFHRPVSTNSTVAQRYFDQGMRLLWSFNHDESTRSFAQAASLDPHCAMCFWGVALTVGPNYNLPGMAPARAQVAFAAAQRAKLLSAKAPPVERALIDALARRYPNAHALDPSNEGLVLGAYAQAMRQVAARFPGDLDVQTLFAEAMMTQHAWKLWSANGEPAADTPLIESTLEDVLRHDPSHPGANHYYIHTMEASPHPEKALASAQRLQSMMPMAGHLQHMPAHVEQRIGQYAQAARANRDGIAADQAYMALTHPPDYYSMYLGHNYLFLAYSTAMQGRRAETLETVRKLRAVMPDGMLSMAPGVDWYMTEIYFGMERFGLWDQILAEPAPDTKFVGWFGGYLAARAGALAAKGRLSEADAALSQLQALASVTNADYPAGQNSARDVFAVAIAVAKARLAAAHAHDIDPDTIAAWRDAVAAEDRLAYDEPDDWFVPVRHQLGAALLKTGRAAEAESIYREDLLRHPHNGWALFGLAASLREQGRIAEAEKADVEFADAWKNSDFTLTASAL